MPQYEYKVVPAPSKGLKAKGLKTPEARFSNAIQSLMNQLAAQGWEYQRAEMLPSVERSGLTSTTTEWRNVLVFRRPRADTAEAFAPELLPAPDAVADTPPDTPDTPKETGNGAAAEAADAPATEEAEDSDNGVEDTDDIKGVGASLGSLAASRKTPKPDG